MSEQILLQGKILGTGEFLVAGHAEGRSARSAGEDLLAGRSQWLSLLGEVLPRALLAELGLARILLGSSGGGHAYGPEGMDPYLSSKSVFLPVLR